MPSLRNISLGRSKLDNEEENISEIEDHKRKDSIWKQR